MKCSPLLNALCIYLVVASFVPKAGGEDACDTYKNATQCEIYKTDGCEWYGSKTTCYNASSGGDKADPCEEVSKDKCSKDEGCAWSSAKSVCYHAENSCSKYENEVTCEAEGTKCSWHAPKKICYGYGKKKTCDSYGDEDQCVKSKGCAWHGDGKGYKCGKKKGLTGVAIALIVVSSILVLGLIFCGVMIKLRRVRFVKPEPTINDSEKDFSLIG